MYDVPVLFGVLLALATSVSWAFGNVFIQRSGRALGAPRALTWALLVGAVASGAAALLLDNRSAPVTPAVVGWTCAATVSGLAAYAGLFYAFAHARLSIAVPFVASWSLIAGIFSFAAFGERPRSWQLGGAGLVVFGVLLVALGAGRQSDGTEPGRSGRAVWAAVGSAVGFGVMVPAMGHIAPAVGGFGTSAVVYGLGLFVAAPLLRAGGISLAPPSASVWPVVVATGLTETLGFVCITVARQFAPTAVVAPVASLSTALTVVYAWVVLRERPRPIVAAGAVAASVGLLLLAA